MKPGIALAILILTLLVTSTSAQTLEAREAFKKGYTLLNEGKYFSSIENFKLSIADFSYPLLDYSYYYIARAYQESSHPEEALEVYEIVVKVFPDSTLVASSLFEIAKIHSENKDYETAVSILKESIAKYPKHEIAPAARFALAKNLEKTDNYEEAARVYRNLDLLHPKSEFANKALAELKKLAKKTPLPFYEASAADIYNRGISYFSRRNYTKAKEYFTRITRFHKKSTFYDESLLMLGRIFLRKGELEIAANYFKKSINQGKDAKPEAMYYLALTYNYMDSPKAAVTTLEKLVSLYPKSHIADEALSYLGRYYKKEKDLDKALAAFLKITSEYTHSSLLSEALWNEGNIYYKKGQYEKAYETFDAASQKYSTAQLFFWKGKSAARAGKKEEAIATYKTTLRQFDHSYYAYRASEELKKYGIKTEFSAPPAVSEIVEIVSQNPLYLVGHQEKQQELIALGLTNEATKEASLVKQQPVAQKKGNVDLAQYHSYVKKGKFSKPISFAAEQIHEAMLLGELSEVDPLIWRFSYPRGYWQYVEKYSEKYGLDPHLVYAVIREESRFKSQALSHAWAHGLMQIIPSTGRGLARGLGMSYSRWKLYNPRVNIQMGTYFLSKLIKRFNGNVPLALAGYNGGPVRVSRWLKNYEDFDLDEFVEDIPITETRNYVKKVMKSYYGYKRTYPSGS
ncbi:MAG: tetratricopeptide repeat protein [Candidatus Saganbacteria bacterium]|nr:tetratricopeptide repeat protein [Candidatus Saganbacteria bacterium]